MSYTLQPKISKFLNYIDPIKTVECYYFNYLWSLFEMMCVALTDLLLRNVLLFTRNLKHIIKILCTPNTDVFVKSSGVISDFIY